MRRRLFAKRHTGAGPRLSPLRGGAILAATAIGLLALSHAYPSETAAVRQMLTGPTDTVLGVLRTPVEPARGLVERLSDTMDLLGEVRRLRAENEELRGWQWRAAELERQLAELTAIANRVPEAGISFLTMRIRARSVAPFGRSVLIDAGGEAGLLPGQAVVNGEGVIGFVSEVGSAHARVRLLADAASRVTVKIGRNAVLATAVGEDRHLLTLADVAPPFDVADGDEVTTAGIEGGPPGGLRVGRVVRSSRGLAIRPHADPARADFVSVLLSPLATPTPLTTASTGPGFTLEPSRARSFDREPGPGSAPR
ncbi:MAG: rod shape-determining protein MreC [Hyphomicrobiaceae bacterium]|nr:rod shape-determining protein MreC [Hyphomicrobiaceae bacterium]